MAAKWLSISGEDLRGWTVLHPCTTIKFCWWITLKLHCMSPRTSCLRQQGITAITIYIYQLGRRSWTRSTHLRPLQWQLQVTEFQWHMELVFSKDLAVKINMWTHKKWCLLCKRWQSKIFDCSSRVPVRHFVNICPQYPKWHLICGLQCPGEVFVGCATKIRFLWRAQRLYERFAYSESASDWIWKTMITSRSSMPPNALFVSWEPDSALRNRKYSTKFTLEELIDTMQTCRRVKVKGTQCKASQTPRVKTHPVESYQDGGGNFITASDKKDLERHLFWSKSAKQKPPLTSNLSLSRTNHRHTSRISMTVYY